MKKHLAVLFSLLFAIVMVCSLPDLTASAEGCSLTLEYIDEEAGALEGVTFKLYTIATGYSGRYQLTEAFAGHHADVDGVNWGIGEDMSDLASTLSDYIASDAIEPDKTGITNANGRLTFAGLPNGLYLALGETLTDDGWIYVPQPILIWLPCMNPEGKLDYTPVCGPKHDKYPETVDRIVEKVWVGEGSHPQSVVIQLLCDGEVYSEVTLNALNSWKHVWKDLPGNHNWQVTEKDVPDDYTATITQNGITFTVTNTKNTPPASDTPNTPDVPDTPDVPNTPDIPNTPDNPDEPDNPPKTGDESMMGMYISLMLISGAGILMTALNGKRSKKQD